MCYRNISGRGNQNLPGVITENLGGIGYVIPDTTDNKVVRRHPDHIFRGGTRVHLQTSQNVFENRQKNSSERSQRRNTSKKYALNFYFLSLDSSLVMNDPHWKLNVCTENIAVEGTVF